MEYRKLSKEEQSIHPSIHCSGSIQGMKKLGYWGKHDQIVRCGQHYYNMSIRFYGR